MSFEGNHIGVRRSDGALVNSVISPHVSVLHGYAEASLWQDALRLCRALKVSAIINPKHTVFVLSGCFNWDYGTVENIWLMK